MSAAWIRRRILGARLWRAREDAKLSQEEVAAELGCHQTVVSRLEHGEREVKAQEIFVFARLYGTPVETLMGPYTDEERALEEELLADATATSPLLPRRRWRRD